MSGKVIASCADGFGVHCWLLWLFLAVVGVLVAVGLWLTRNM